MKRFILFVFLTLSTVFVFSENNNVEKLLETFLQNGGKYVKVINSSRGTAYFPLTSLNRISGFDNIVIETSTREEVFNCKNWSFSLDENSNLIIDSKTKY